MKEQTKIICKVCKDNKPSIKIFLQKEKWGKNHEQHYRLTCQLCGNSQIVNEEFIKTMEEMEEK